MDDVIFISYRRTDASEPARALFTQLRCWFDEKALFFDAAGIDSGDAFPLRIEQALRSAKVVLVVIGPNWLDSLNERTTSAQVDYVRQEVTLALERHAAGESVLVLPVLLGGAAMPTREALHARLQSPLGPLSDHNAHEFGANQAAWDAGFVRLRERIANVEGVPQARFRAPAGTEQPYRAIDHALSAHFQDPEGHLPALRRSFEHNRTVAVVARAALYGMGGVGKTQLALKYTLDYRDRYAGIWWFGSETERSLQLDAQACCQKVGIPQEEGELPSLALKRWLERQEARWLLVFDNAENVAALRPHLPEGAHHDVIITSRNPSWGGVAMPLPLEVWSPGQAATFLAERLPGAAQAELLALADDLGGLPLALEQAASYLEETGSPIAAYRDLLAGVDTGGLLLGEGRPATGYEHSVIKTLSVAFDRLSPAGQLLLRLCAFAAPEPIPERLFSEALEDLPAPLAEAAGNPLTWNKVIGELRRYGIVNRVDIPAIDPRPGEDEGRTEQALGLHRLTQQVTRSTLAAPEADCRAFQAQLRAGCPDEANLPAHWSRYAAFAEHVTQLDRFYVTGHLDAGKHCWLLDRVATYLQYGPALYADAVRVFRRAIAVNTETLGDEHPDTLENMNNLAGTLWRQGDLAGARALRERVLAVHRRVLGDEHPDTLISMGNFATTLRAQGDLAGARVLHERVLDVRRRVLGEEHPDTLMSMNNLAATLWHQGDFAGARALHECALEVRRHVLGDEHPSTLTSMNNLAVALRSQGDFAAARTLQERVLEVRRRVLGDEHPDTLTSMNNLAITLRGQGDLAGARAVNERVLEVRRRVLGGEHPDTLMSMNNLATTLWRMGERPVALRLVEAAAEGLERVLGADHPNTKTARSTLRQWRAATD